MTQPGLARQIVVTLACHAGTTILCGLLFIVAMNAPPFTAMPILFYRGVVALACCGLIVALALALAARHFAGGVLRAADFIGVALVAVALNLCVFTLGPVTVDRSISVFMLSRFDQAERPLTKADVAGDFTKIYVEDWDQMQRRLDEQTASGNLEKDGDGYRLTAQGRSFMATARLMARVFGTDRRFVGIETK